MAFGSLMPGGGPGAQGMALLKQISSMAQRPGGDFYQDASVSGPFVPGYGATDPKLLHSPGGGPPNAIDNGFIAKLMRGNPGGLIGALMKRQNAPVNPGMPPPPGSPAYVEGGVGPAMGAGGPAPNVGLLSRMFPQMGMKMGQMGMNMGQFGGGSGAPRFLPGDIAGN